MKNVKTKKRKSDGKVLYAARIPSVLAAFIDAQAKEQDLSRTQFLTNLFRVMRAGVQAVGKDSPLFGEIQSQVEQHVRSVMESERLRKDQALAGAVMLAKSQWLRK